VKIMGAETEMVMAAANQQCPRTPLTALLRELAAMMLAHPWLLALTILPNIISPAVAPVQAWLAKEVLQEISQGERWFTLGELLTYAPYALVIFLGLTSLHIVEKVTNRMYDDRLLIDVQRRWFEIRGDGCAGDHVAKATNDCKNVVKLFDLAQKEIWVVIIGVPAVLIWQLTLSPELLPALLVSALVPFTASLAFGAIIQQLSHKGLVLLSGVSSAIAQGNRKRLHEEQEKLYVNRVKFELTKQASEAIGDFAFWLSLVFLLLVSLSGVWELLPPELTAAQIGVFLVNLKLLNHPLSAVTKMHNKIRESWPSVRRALRPHETRVGELSL
jgi:ABC-type multidrug transport system fused ATPase/permease subunit